jgi:RNA polymerase sigma-70 factor (sigma-E family)
VAGWPDEEFNEFVGARSVALVRFAYRLTGDLGHAQDLVQTALLSVYLRSRRRVPDAPEAYVRKAVLNAFLSGQRRKRVPEDLVDVVPERPGPPSDSPVEQRAAVSGFLTQLPPRQRAVLVLRYFEDWSEERIAEELHMPKGTVKSLASRGLATLRAQAHEPERSCS